MSKEDRVPTSSTEHKAWALDTIRRLDPKVIVDIGPGEGTYSVLARKHTRDAHWVAIEAWAPYIPRYGLWGKYNHVVVSDVRHCDFNTITSAPDLVIIGDVLEHMTHIEARTVLERLKMWADRILVCVPLEHNDQGEYEGNWFEIHREHWSGEQMRAELADGLEDYREGQVLGYYLWSCYAVG